DLRRRDALGRVAGRLVQAPREAHLPHVPAPQSLRAHRVARGEDDHPLLAHRSARRDRRRDPRVRDTEIVATPIQTSRSVEPDGPIGAAHAGWQGTSLRIASGLVEALVAAGAKRERFVASIGPSIGPCCYAIDAERADLIQERIGADSLVRADGRIVFDLWD